MPRQGMPCLYNAPPDDRRDVICNQLQCLINALICITIVIIIISGGLYYGYDTNSRG